MLSLILAGEAVFVPPFHLGRYFKSSLLSTFAIDEFQLGQLGAIYGILLAFAFYYPRERIYIWGILPVEAWLLVTLAVGFSVYAGFGGSGGTTAHFAHLGGLVFAWVYLKWREWRQGSARRSFQQKLEASPSARLSDRAQLSRWQSIDVDGLHEINREAFTRVAQDIVEEQGGIAETGADGSRGVDPGKGDSRAEAQVEQPGRASNPQSRSPDVRIYTPSSTDDHARSVHQRRTRTEPVAPFDDSPRISPDARAPAPEHADNVDGTSSPSSSQETTMERTESLNKILKSLQSGSPDVEASALITEDGLMIASSLPQDLDEVTVGGMSATLLHLGTRAATALHRGEVREVIVRGEGGYGVMVSAGRGVLLLVVANENAKLGLIFFDMRAAINAIKQVL
jgi:predicted regulator of Ras-like GTPase activity (Roadblock/LC7/MglB family)